MRVVTALGVVVLLGIFGCSSSVSRTTSIGNAPSSPSVQHPGWVDALIAQFQAAAVGNPPQSIWRYDYRGGEVYFVPAQCCDLYSQLYDARGKLIGAPDGGQSGTGDGTCPDFFTARTNGSLIWSDPRTSDSPSRLPLWVSALIAQFAGEAVGNPPQSIWRYDYRGGQVYYIPAQCCDQPSQLYDAKGLLLGAPDGGQSGTGDGTCADFFTTRTNENLIWRDQRTSVAGQKSAAGKAHS